MDTKQLINIMSICEKLKIATRHSWTSSGRHESVAEHSWRLSLLAYFVRDEYPEVDISKVILMCLCHDIGEAYTGDIPAFLKTKDDEMVEDNAVTQFIRGLPQPYMSELTTLFGEMNSLNTQEAKLYKALDKMEALIQHNESDIATWLPLEYELNLTYGTEETAFSEYMLQLKQELNNASVQKMRNQGEPAKVD